MVFCDYVICACVEKSGNNTLTCTNEWYSLFSGEMLNEILHNQAAPWLKRFDLSPSLIPTILLFSFVILLNLRDIAHVSALEKKETHEFISVEYA